MGNPPQRIWIGASRDADGWQPDGEDEGERHPSHLSCASAQCCHALRSRALHRSVVHRCQNEVPSDVPHRREFARRFSSSRAYV